MRTLRLGLAQINATVGDIDGNEKRIIQAIDRAGRMTSAAGAYAGLPIPTARQEIKAALAARGLIRRTASDADRRQVFVVLTPQGVRTFERVFPAHIGHLKPVFTVLSPRELDQATELLHKLRDALREARVEQEAA